MDSNGTKFHLVHLKSDWESWWSVRHGVTLRELFDDASAFPDAEIEWNRGEQNLRLSRQALQFQGSDKVFGLQLVQEVQGHPGQLRGHGAGEDDGAFPE